jgi:uncharacterized protein YacL (UPF0231 family)
MVVYNETYDREPTMKKLLLILFVLLASCAPAAVEATVTPAPTSTPIPTATVIPTPTLAPDFLALQETIAQTDNYTLMGDGQIEVKQPDGTVIPVPGIRLNKDGKSYTIMVDGTEVTIDVNDVTISDEGGVQVKGYQNVDGDDEYEEILVYTAEQLAKMNASDLLKNAPVIEDHEKTASRAGKHVVLYINAEGVIDQAYNYLTGEMTAVIEISFDPNRPTKISMDDLVTGKLPKSELLQCPGFSDKAVPANWQHRTAEGSDSSVLIGRDDISQPYQDYSDPETRPQKLCSFSELTIDLGRGEMPYIVIGVAQLNKDYSTSYFHKVARMEDLQKALDNAPDNYYSIMTEQLRTNDILEKATIIGMYPDMKELGEKMGETDILPKEFETRLIATITSPW